MFHADRQSEGQEETSSCCLGIVPSAVCVCENLGNVGSQIQLCH